MSEPENAQRHDALQGEIVHEYDGILEADNALPRWWLGIFGASIVFALGYWFVYESWSLADHPRAQYAAALAAAAAGGGADVSEEILVMLADDPAVVARGRGVFEANCVACHGARAEGNIGPNLTDAVWLHGGAPVSIHETVHDGFTARGMPAWGPVLGAQQVQAVVAYVLTVRDTNVPGRAPEGVPLGQDAAPGAGAADEAAGDEAGDADVPPAADGPAARIEPTAAGQRGI